MEVALDHFRLFQEFAEICMENHHLPLTISINCSFERPLMQFFSLKHAKLRGHPPTKIGPRGVKLKWKKAGIRDKI